MTVAAVPAGVATAVYLTEYASAESHVARLVRVCIANLAGVPSIVFGLFGLGFFISTVGHGHRPGRLRRTADVRPAVAHLGGAHARDPHAAGRRRGDGGGPPGGPARASRREPRARRDASSRRSLRVVLPEALGGILTGGILAVSRGAGEVAPIMFTGAAYFLPLPADAPERPVHEPRLPRVRPRHAVARRRPDQAAPLRDGARPARSHLPAQPRGHPHPLAHAPALARHA